MIVFAPTGMGANTSRADLLPGHAERRPGRRSRPRERPRGTLGRAGLVDSLEDAGPSGVAGSRALSPIASSPTSRRGSTSGPTGDGRRRLRFPERTRATCGSTWRAANARESSIRARADELLDGDIDEGLLTFRDPTDPPRSPRSIGCRTLAGDRPYAERPSRSRGLLERSPGGRCRPGELTAPRRQVVRVGVGSGRSGNHTDDAWAVLLPGSSALRDARTAARHHGHRRDGLRSPRCRSDRALGRSLARGRIVPAMAETLATRLRFSRDGGARPRPSALARPSGPARAGVPLACSRASGGRVSDSKRFRCRSSGGSSKRLPVPPSTGSDFWRRASGQTTPTIDDIGRLPILERADVERLGIAGLKTPRSLGHACLHLGLARQARRAPLAARADALARRRARRVLAVGSAGRSASGASRCAAVRSTVRRRSARRC